ncbi:MAG: putative lipid II flippase FtsW [Jatrophihabitantaceae bacterium]
MADDTQVKVHRIGTRTDNDGLMIRDSIAGLLGRARERLRPAPAGQRFLDKPYASVQLLLLAGIGLLGFGILMAVSTTISASHDANGTGTAQIWNQVVKEAEFVALGLPIFWIAVRLPPRAYRVLTYPALGLALLALVAVLIPGVGVNINGANRWINLGPLQVQPSELAKVAMLLWGADLLARKQQLGTLRRARHLFLPLIPGFLLVGLLVMLEPDLGTTCCFVLILLGLLWMVGMPLRYFGAVVGVVVGSVVALAFAAPYRWERVTTFLHPFKDAQNTGFHTVEGLYALASGGFFGVGLGQGTSKYGWVPNANSDYVFAIIGEEVGLIGCLAVLALFGLFAYTGMRVSRRNADPFVRLVSGAATIWLCGQAIINIGYVTGLLPVTGIPLPFISAGGTSLLASFFVLGMLVSFARHEAPAVAVARKADRLHRRTRLERWLHIPVPKAYAPPRRRPARAASARAASVRAAPARPAAPARVRSSSAAPPRANSQAPLRATGTDSRRGRR